LQSPEARRALVADDADDIDELIKESAAWTGSKERTKPSRQDALVILSALLRLCDHPLLLDARGQAGAAIRRILLPSSDSSLDPYADSVAATEAADPVSPAMSSNGVSPSVKPFLEAGRSSGDLLHPLLADAPASALCRTVGNPEEASRLRGWADLGTGITLSHDSDATEIVQLDVPKVVGASSKISAMLDVLAICRAERRSERIRLRREAQSRQAAESGASSSESSDAGSSSTEGSLSDSGPSPRKGALTASSAVLAWQAAVDPHSTASSSMHRKKHKQRRHKQRSKHTKGCR